MAPMHYNRAGSSTRMNQEVRLLFHELADLAPADRERILRERRIGPEVRAEIESLLSFDSTSVGFDSTGVESFTECVSDTAGEVLEFADSGQPRYCGPYRLVRLLGSGGRPSVATARSNERWP
jgi:hypothetical protein